MTAIVLAATRIVLTPLPSPSATTLQAPPAGPLFTIAAIVGILFALAAGVVGYRIIRGGRGL